jgi:phosphoribosylformimino-5-aminoimidazole carboxamide ribotide isomerase
LSVATPVQLGGGIHTLDTIETWLGNVARPGHSRGATEACARTPAVPRPRRWHRRQGRQVAVEGWAEATSRRHRAGAPVRNCRGAAVIYTDIDRDGVLSGLSLPATSSWRAPSPSRHRLGRLAGPDVRPVAAGASPRAPSPARAPTGG